MRQMIRNREKEIWWLFKVKGLSPSQIDRKMGMLDGMAHNKIVARWLWDKEGSGDRRVKR